MPRLKQPSNLGRFVISRVAEGPSTNELCTTPEALANYWNSQVAGAPDYTPDQERIVAVILNPRMRPTGWHLVALGTCNECLARVSEILRPAVVCNSYAFALIHNHPSGDVSPSEADNRLTQRVKDAATLMGIRLIDHLIVTEQSRLMPNASRFFSFRETGLL
jgi:DNA repair protein RadC